MLLSKLKASSHVIKRTSMSTLLLLANRLRAASVFCWLSTRAAFGTANSGFHENSFIARGSMVFNTVRLVPARALLKRSTWDRMSSPCATLLGLTSSAGMSQAVRCVLVCAEDTLAKKTTLATEDKKGSGRIVDACAILDNYTQLERRDSCHDPPTPAVNGARKARIWIVSQNSIRPSRLPGLCYRLGQVTPSRNTELFHAE